MVSSLRSNKVIHDIKDYPVIQLSFQEPSTSSKHSHEGPHILDTLLMQILTQNYQGTFLGVNKVIHDIKDDPVIQVSCQEPSMFSKYPQEGPPILDTLLIKISTRNFKGIFLWVKQNHPWHQGWPCPPSILSGTIIVLQVPSLRKEGSWHTTNWARGLKFGMHD